MRVTPDVVRFVDRRSGLLQHLACHTTDVVDFCNIWLAIRPILVRFARALDATKVMSNRKKLSDIPGISIKPQMSTHELKIESILLKERRSLLNSGTQSKQIKMNTAKGELLVNNTLHGRVNRQTNTFVYTTDLPSHDCDVNTPESDSEPDSQPDVQPDPHHDGASSKN